VGRGAGRTIMTADTPIGERWRSLAKKIGKNLIVIPEARPEMMSVSAIMEGMYRSDGKNEK
jgi:hypothetical protein